MECIIGVRADPDAIDITINLRKGLPKSPILAAKRAV